MVDISILFKGMSINFLVFFFLAFLYNQTRLARNEISTFSRDCLTGIVFGAIACFGMAMGIELQPGLKVDGRIVIVGMAAAYGGPVSGGVAALCVSGFRAFIGGAGVYVGLAGIIGGFVVGSIFHRYLAKKPIPYDWKSLALLGLLLTLQAQLLVPLFFPFEVALKILKKVFIVGIGFYPFAAVTIGLLLNNGIKREQLRIELEESHKNIEEKVKLRTAELEEANNRLKNLIDEKTRVEHNLRQALDEIETLSGILPICAHCKDIRNNDGDWVRMETYIQSKSAAEFSHSVCDKCFEEHYSD